MAQHRSLTHVRTTAITNNRQIRAIFPKMALYTDADEQGQEEEEEEGTEIFFCHQ